MSSVFQILLADDDADDRSLFQEAVDEVARPAALTALENGHELLTFLSAVKTPPPPHIIFLDINMPMKTGKECLLAIRSDPKFDQVPVIMFTTSSHNTDIEDSYNAGANMYISKSAFFDNDVDILNRLVATDWKDYFPKPPRDKFAIV